MVAGVAAVIAMVFLECHDFINAASTINRVGSDPAVQRNAFFSNRGVVRADVIVVDNPVLCVCAPNAGTACQALAGTVRKTCGRRKRRQSYCGNGRSVPPAQKNGQRCVLHPGRSMNCIPAGTHPSCCQVCQVFIQPAPHAEIARDVQRSQSTGDCWLETHLRHSDSWSGGQFVSRGLSCH